jgi:hypothetical protein
MRSICWLAAVRTVVMSDEFDWDFVGADDAKAEMRAAFRYLLEGSTGGARGDIVQEIITIVRQVSSEPRRSDTSQCALAMMDVASSPSMDLTRSMRGDRPSLWRALRNAVD